MLGDVGRRVAIAVIAGGVALLVLGVFIVLASQPVPRQDFGFVGGQGQHYFIDAGGMVSSGPQFLSPATGGVFLGAGMSLAAGVAGYVLGRRRR